MYILLLFIFLFKLLDLRILQLFILIRGSDLIETEEKACNLYIIYEILEF